MLHDRSTCHDAVPATHPVQLQHSDVLWHRCMPNMFSSSTGTKCDRSAGGELEREGEVRGAREGNGVISGGWGLVSEEEK
jgi:hypothetical protein